MILFIIGIGVALSVSFFCSLLEAALLSLTPNQLADLKAKHPRTGDVWICFKDKIERPIAAILIANTAAHTIGASIAGAEFDALFGDKWIWLFSLIFTLVMIQFTEILPKTVGVRFNRTIARFSTRPLQFAIWGLAPFIKLVNLINRPFEGRKASDSHSISTLEEISTLAGLARLARQINPRQERIIQGASRLSRCKLEQIMIPIDQVACLSLSQTMMEALIAAHVDAHTRFPVCEENDRNRIIGYVNFKEMVYHMRINPSNPSLKGIARPILFVRSEDSVASLLETFVSKHIHMAIVRNGNLNLGLITLEDIVEELVGEIEDELDHLPQTACRLGDDLWTVGGGDKMNRFAAESEYVLPPSSLSVADWLAERLDHIPHPGDMIKEGEIEITVRRVRRGRVFEAAFTRKKIDG